MFDRLSTAAIKDPLAYELSSSHHLAGVKTVRKRLFETDTNTLVLHTHTHTNLFEERGDIKERAQN